MAALTVKAYLLGKEEAAREIRRFALPPPARYQHIHDRVAELFQGLLRAGPPPAFRMHYKGERGWRGVPLPAGPPERCPPGTGLPRRAVPPGPPPVTPERAPNAALCPL